MQASVHEAKTNLSKLLEKVAQGERVIITRHGVPAAELVPPRPQRQIRFGILKGVVAPPPDEFYEDMTEEELRLWEGGE
ncbi:MAG: type II toxin-antitoxin system prevent-host-death family antitoxin [Pseudomonadota bacterium]